MNKYQEALNLIRKQLQQTPQNVELLSTLQQLVNHNILDEFYEIGDGTVCRNYDEEEE